jgi:heat-inducible transcriptional repressor
MENMDERSKRVLCAIVQSYIRNPEPVGSRFVTKKYSFGCSPATIRNIMADLEELGYLSQPYTSAGRVPTDRGYRFYVNCLSEMEEFSNRDDNFREFFLRFTKRLKNIKNDVNSIFLEMTNALSSISNYIGVATPPKTEKTTLNKIDFIRYKENKAVAILLTEEGVIKNKVIDVDTTLSQEDLSRLADFLNSEYSGHTIDEIKNMLVKKMYTEKLSWDRLIDRAIRLYEQALSFKEEEIFMSGIFDMMNLPDFSDISRIREIAKTIKDKHLILKLLDQISNSEGVQVLIGNENPIEQMRSLSVVASTYKEKNKNMGVIALIGPRRMDYPKAIYMVDTLAKYLSRTFE